MTRHENNTVTDIRSQQILSELVEILYYQPLYTILAGNGVAAGITVVFLWDTVPQHWLIIWVALMLVFTLIWIVLVALYRSKRPSIESAKNWIHLFPVSATFTGLTWGITAFWPQIMIDNTVTVFLSIMVLGVTAAGLAVFSPYLRSYVAFAGLTLSPFFINFLLQDSKLHLTLGIMFLLYLGVILLSGYHMKLAVRKTIELRLENLDLVDDLVVKNNLAEQAREDAEQADISKSKFLAAASHDLRQPLHALGLFVDALESRIQFPEVRDIVENIRISTDALSDLLNALLDISKLDAGVIEPQISQFQLQSIFKRIQNDFSEQAKGKSLQLRIVETGYAVETDSTMLERILLNLVSNAIRYTQQGKVLLGCRWHGDSISIEVHDTGMGIAEHEIDNIFDEFYQLDNPERDRSKGLGLGLAIVKRQAALLHCPVNISSTVKKGSVFRISVPRVDAEISAPSEIKHFTRDLQGIRVLVMDDESMIRVAMREVLEKWQCQVIEAESAEQALDQLNDDCKLDIILTDYRLREEKTGIQAIHQIHAHCGQNIPAIILTGDTDPQRLREAKDSGYKLLHKPISAAKLRSLMSYLLDTSKPG